MPLKVVEVFIGMKMVRDLVVDNPPVRKVSKKEDRNTHLSELADIISSGCAAQGVDMVLLKKCRLTHKTFGDLQIMLELVT